MESIETTQARAAALSELLKAKFGVRGKTLAVQTRRLGRRVPAKITADLLRVASAVDDGRHPERAKRHAPEAVAASARAATRYLEQEDPADRRRGAVLSWLAGNAANILIVGTAFVAVLVWRGFV